MSEITQEQQANRERWARALESGSYLQTRGTLNNGERYCCLGVACELFGKGEWAPGANGIVHPRSYIEDSRKYEGFSLPSSVSEALGFTADAPASVGDKDNFVTGEAVLAADQNDLYKKSFPEIAAWIREGMPN